MKYSKELEAKLARLTPRERKRVEAVGHKVAKRRLAKMMDQTALAHRKTRSWPVILSSPRACKLRLLSSSPEVQWFRFLVSPCSQSY